MGENRFKSTAEPDPRQPEETLTPQQEEMEQHQQEAEEKAKENKDKKKKRKKGKGGVMTILGGRFLVKESFTKQFPFIVYITLLLMTVITNTYIAEKKNREFTQTAKKLNDLQVEYIQLKSAIMEASKQSVLTKKLSNTGLKQAIEPLKRITTDTTTRNTEKQ